MAHIMDRSGGEGALRTLEMQVMLAKDVEDGPEMLEVLYPCGTVYQYVIEEHQDAATQERLEDDIHQCLERRRSI